MGSPQKVFGGRRGAVMPYCSNEAEQHMPPPTDKPPLLKALGALAVGAGVALTQTPASAARPEETAAYEQALSAGTPDALRDFLRRYPDGVHAAPVFSLLARGVQVAQAGPSPAAREEIDAFEAAMRAGTPEALGEFLARYPDSPLAGAVSRRMEELETGPPPAGDFFSTEPMIY